MIIFKRWSVLREKRPPGFSISVFGRFAYSLSALVGLTVFGFDRLRLLEFFDVSSPISDRLYANSRTPDIGKARGPLFSQNLWLAVVLWFVFGMLAVFLFFVDVVY